MGTHLEAAAHVAQAPSAILAFMQERFIPDHTALAEVVETDMIAPGVDASSIVETQAGNVAIGDLRAGDKVMTRDNGLQPLLWVGCRDIRRGDLQAKPWFCPVVIEPHALKPGLPDRRLMVSQQLLLLVRSRIAQRMVGAPEVLVPADQLCQVEGIGIDRNAPDLSYVSLLFSSHQIISVNGVETGSLHLDAATLANLPAGLRAELQAMVPGPPNPVSARMILEGRMGRRLADRHRRNDKRLIA